MANKILEDAVNSVQIKPVYVEVLLHSDIQKLLQGLDKSTIELILMQFVNLRLEKYLNEPVDGLTHLEFYRNLKKEKRNGKE